MGRMIAEGLVAAGASVIVTSRHADEAAAAAEALAAAAPGRATATGLAADLGVDGGAEALATAVIARDAPLHILVNNAGRTWGAPFDAFPAKAWARVMAVNVEAPFTLVRDLRRLLRASAGPEDPARVVNIGSAAGAKVEDLPAYSYSASKAAIHHLSRVMAIELARDPITVNTICPGYFPTRMTAHIRAEAEALDRLTDHIPMRRLGTPEDIAGTCVFLCSRAGAYLTGTLIPVDGGLLAGG
jgi:NAD(P)-dependent dehydrogenase (short-subunit alcohol dehydrogenase family)